MMNSAALAEGVQLIRARSAQVEVNLNKEWPVAVRFNLTEKTDSGLNVVNSLKVGLK